MLLQVFNPKIKGTLQYEYGDVKKRIRCQVEKGPVFKNRDKSFKYQDYLINLLCPNPYWQDIAEIPKQTYQQKLVISFPLHSRKG